MSDWFEAGRAGAEVSATVLLDSEAMARLLGMVDMGALVSLSLTSDRGALGVTITVDGRWRREYFRDSDQLELWTEEAMAPVQRACDGRTASSEGATRQRGRRRP